MSWNKKKKKKLPILDVLMSGNGYNREVNMELEVICT